MKMVMVSCSRCRSIVNENEGTRDTSNLNGYLIEPKRNIVLKTHISYTPDLCPKCVEELNKWFDNEEKDYSVKGYALNAMAKEIRDHRECGDTTDIYNEFIDHATEEIRITKELRKLQK
ncbi:MAG: hypothetical protein PF518_04895 [Spirochaetaceae bacterium]|jgi:hypothetical protein|nr:hypothetical protein [Spirochaetaceae bacterium]